MNYLHAYHAGSPADVFKHVILVELLLALLEKDKPFCYLDTHAGKSHYDLSSEPAQRTREYRRGIGKLWNLHEQLPAVLKPYMEIVAGINADPKLTYYPGSSWFASTILRAQDRLVLTEKSNFVYQTLKEDYSQDRRVQVHHQDGYQGLKAYLPPKERRGVVFIDPPYESETEFQQLPDNIVTAYKRWSTGIFAVWYPIKDRAPIDCFVQSLSKQIPPNDLLFIELCTLPPDVSQRLNGSGVVIINPPWQLEAKLRKVLPAVLEILKQHEGAYLDIFPGC
jgi:23S rRNA (adenine2030-N6)-methyltransferase